MNAPEAAPALLAAFKTQLEELDVTVPERAYIAPGQVAVWDGEQLTVTLTGIGQGSPGKPDPGTFVPGAEILQAGYAVYLIREVPGLSGEGAIQGQLPSAEELDESGQQTVADAQAMFDAAMAIHADHTITEAALQGFSVGELSTLGPEGGLAGVRLPIGINLG